MKNTPALRQAKIDLTAALPEAGGLMRAGWRAFVTISVSRFRASSGEEAFLINPQGIHWSDMRPADLVVVDVNGNKFDGVQNVEPTAFFIHGQVHMAKKNAKCIMHTHMPYATALTLLEDGGLEWVSLVNSLRNYGRVAYDTYYGGLALDPDAGKPIWCASWRTLAVLFMANHGVLMCGPSISNVFDDMYYLERACMVQVLAQSTGKKLRYISEDVARSTAAQFEQERQQSTMHFDAMKRMLDRTSPGWSDMPE